MNAVWPSASAFTSILSRTSWTSSPTCAVPMLNCTSIAGGFGFWKIAGAFGFSNEKSLTYCEIRPAAGAVSSPLPVGCVSIVVPLSWSAMETILREKKR
ncbi:hypothetical protein WR25_04118 [Diploscapter pachys]|uniref:Uncharacterized protein n=1 Tax=Diploscapter pachys TaxID=2018661 RepID=A0A2A2M328_9BILA|nr:hypothetical protein WR25_04118 [Diploscapter pachys]